MPRTVESIVACHQAATSLRKAGKPIWGRTINIRSILAMDEGDRSAEKILEKARLIAAQIRLGVPATWLDRQGDGREYRRDLEEVVEQLEQITLECLLADKELEPVEWLDEWLDQLYDWADGERVWIG